MSLVDVIRYELQYIETDSGTITGNEITFVSEVSLVVSGFGTTVDIIDQDTGVAIKGTVTNVHHREKLAITGTTKLLTQSVDVYVEK